MKEAQGNYFTLKMILVQETNHGGSYSTSLFADDVKRQIGVVTFATISFNASLKWESFILFTVVLYDWMNLSKFRIFWIASLLYQPIK